MVVVDRITIGIGEVPANGTTILGLGLGVVKVVCLGVVKVVCLGVVKVVCLGVVKVVCLDGGALGYGVGPPPFGVVGATVVVVVIVVGSTPLLKGSVICGVVKDLIRSCSRTLESVRFAEWLKILST